MDTYIDIRSVADFPSFHDAELIGIEHDPQARSLKLRFLRAGGEVEVLRFSWVIGLRMIDFAEQNVVSRFWISPWHVFLKEEARTWIQWIHSRDDSKEAAISEQKRNEYIRTVKNGLHVLFVLEPSCGVELALLCESLSLKV